MRDHNALLEKRNRALPVDLATMVFKARHCNVSEEELRRPMTPSGGYALGTPGELRSRRGHPRWFAVAFAYQWSPANSSAPVVAVGQCPIGTVGLTLILSIGYIE